MSRLKRASKGFTLLELVVVVGILALITAIVATGVTGTVGSARTATKDGDMKNADTAVSRYESENTDRYPISGPSTNSTSTLPTVAVAGQGSGGTVTIYVETDASHDFTPSTGDVECGSSGTTSVEEALADCFGNIDFSLLVPTYVKNEPQHADDFVPTSAASTSTPAFTFDNCTLDGETCDVYLDTALGSGILKVWTVDKNNNIVVFKVDTEYGQ